MLSCSAFFHGIVHQLHKTDSHHHPSPSTILSIQYPAAEHSQSIQSSDCCWSTTIRAIYIRLAKCPWTVVRLFLLPLSAAVTTIVVLVQPVLLLPSHITVLTVHHANSSSSSSLPAITAASVFGQCPSRFGGFQQKCNRTFKVQQTTQRWGIEGDALQRRNFT